MESTTTTTAAAAESVPAVNTSVPLEKQLEDAKNELQATKQELQKLKDDVGAFSSFVAPRDENGEVIATLGSIVDTPRGIGVIESVLISLDDTTKFRVFGIYDSFVQIYGIDSISRYLPA